MFLQPQTVTNQLNNNGINAVIDGLDATIMRLAKQQYGNQVLGFRDTVDFVLFKRLCIYREILLDKLLGCNCLDDVFLTQILERIKKLID